MPEKTKKGTRGNARWLLHCGAMCVYDILAVNLSILLALYVRFYVAGAFHADAVRYFAAYHRYALVYTLYCLAVFACFRLYSGMWEYAGFNDLNRILAANMVVLFGHVVGTLMTGIRMPISFYAMGALFLLLLVAIGRFSHRFFQAEKNKFRAYSKNASNALIVGVGVAGREVMKQMDREENVRPVCILDCREESYGSLFDGLPVVNGVEKLRETIQKYNVKLVVLASSAIPQETAAKIKTVCHESGAEVREYFSFFQSVGSGITLKHLAEYTDGPVELVVGGEAHSFSSCDQAVLTVPENYVVASIRVKNGVLRVEMKNRSIVPNDLDADWVKLQQQETGEEISFF